MTAEGTRRLRWLGSPCRGNAARMAAIAMAVAAIALSGWTFWFKLAARAITAP